jgi:hypothetical protein
MAVLGISGEKVIAACVCVLGGRSAAPAVD